MHKQLSESGAKVLQKVIEALSNTYGEDADFHVLLHRVCDYCEDEEKEAFPDIFGEEQHICNDCTEEYFFQEITDGQYIF